MKLRNKKTGVIHKITQAVILSDDMNKKFAIYSQSVGHNYAYRSLAELNAEWEDYEETKEYWYINFNLECIKTTDDDTKTDEYHKLIGNYFETKEEAEKAVEKLKAWKRLKDNGFKFEGLEKRGRHIHFYQGKSYKTDEQCQQAMKDLDLLFCTEEKNDFEK